MIEALGLSKRYGTREAVREATFTVGNGEVVGLLGPNGAGKSTIMKILTCSLFPTTGTARIDTDDVLENPLEAKSRIGYVAENAPLYGDLSVREYLDFMARARGLSRAARASGFERVVHDCGLDSVVDRSIDTLSKGFRQRTALAQALIHDPGTLILDEPTTGLDPQQIVGIRALIRGLGSSKAVLLSSHILAEVEATCGRLLIMSEGRIVAQGTRDEIARGMEGEARLDLTVRFDPSDRGRPTGLGAVGGVIRVEAEVPQAAGTVTYRLAVSPGVAVEERIFDWAVTAGAKIVAMTVQQPGLERVFLSLTGQEGER